MMVTDSTLLRRYLEDGSEAALTELVRRHIDLVYSAATRRTDGDATRAGEVPQLVFIAPARDAATLSRHPTLTGWLYTVTRNAALYLIRVERRRRACEQEAMKLHDQYCSDRTDANWEQLRPVLDSAMDALTESDRPVELLRFFEKSSYREIATTLEVSYYAARMRTERAFEKLRALLARHRIPCNSL